METRCSIVKKYISPFTKERKSILFSLPSSRSYTRMSFRPLRNTSVKFGRIIVLPIRLWKCKGFLLVKYAPAAQWFNWSNSKGSEHRTVEVPAEETSLFHIPRAPRISDEERQSQITFKRLMFYYSWRCGSKRFWVATLHHHSQIPAWTRNER